MAEHIIDRWDRERQDRDQRRQVEGAESDRRAALCRVDETRIAAQHQHAHDMATIQDAADTVDQLERDNAELLETLEAFVIWDMRRNIRPYIGGLDELLERARDLIARAKGEQSG